MEKQMLVEMVESGLSTRQIARSIGKSQYSVKYWLSKYRLKTKWIVNNKGGHSAPIWERIARDGSEFRCRCGETRSSEFMRNGAGRRSYSLCKKCHTAYCVDRQRELKRKAVEYKGGRCSKCGYDRCVGSLQFHHCDPSIKDPKWRTARGWDFEKFKVELDKCVLLCSNCHGEVHWNDL